VFGRELANCVRSGSVSGPNPTQFAHTRLRADHSGSQLLLLAAWLRGGASADGRADSQTHATP
jgi:hypothetical protein